MELVNPKHQATQTKMLGALSTISQHIKYMRREQRWITETMIAVDQYKGLYTSGIIYNNTKERLNSNGNLPGDLSDITKNMDIQE